MNPGMIVQKIPVSEINPAKYNPRKDLKPGDPAYEKLKRSMTEFGYVEPIIWNEETGNIVGGHQRYKILLEEGHTEVECVVVKLPADKEKALNVALNKVTGDWEVKALAELLNDLNEQDFDLTLTGFDAAEIEDLFSQVHDKDVTDDDFDVDAALEEEPISKPGDIWLLGRHRLMCGDSTKAETYEKLMDGKNANLILTDPPYGVAYEGSQGTIKNDNLQDEEFYKFLLSAFKNMESIMATIGNGCIVNTGALIDHDNVIEDYAHISPGVKLAGTVKVGKKSWLGIGSIVSNNISITGECVVGAGSVVINNITEPGIYVGVPARKVD